MLPQTTNLKSPPSDWQRPECRTGLLPYPRHVSCIARRQRQQAHLGKNHSHAGLIWLIETREFPPRPAQAFQLILKAGLDPRLAPEFRFQTVHPRPAQHTRWPAFAACGFAQLLAAGYVANQVTLLTSPQSLSVHPFPAARTGTNTCRRSPTAPDRG